MVLPRATNFHDKCSSICFVPERFRSMNVEGYHHLDIATPPVPQAMLERGRGPTPSQENDQLPVPLSLSGEINTATRYALRSTYWTLDTDCLTAISTLHSTAS
jgi:hypothetical protein